MTSYAQKVVRDGASHLWLLNEGSGTAAADAIGGKGGTYTGAYTQAVAGPPLVGGSRALRLAGAGYVDFANGTGMPSGDPDHTIEAWAYEANATTGKTIIGWGTPATRQQSVFLAGWWFGSARDYHATYNDDPEFLAPTNTPLVWHHVVMTYTAATRMARLYIDGVLTASSPLAHAAALAITTAGLRIGELYYLTGTYPFIGDLACVAVYPLVLTPAQIADHARGDDPALAFPDGLGGNW